MSIETNFTQANIFLGQYRVWNFTVYTPGTTQAMIEADPSANRLNVTNLALTYYLRQKPLESDPPRLVKSTLDTSLFVTNALYGELSCDWTSDDTVNLAPGMYFYTLWDVTSGTTDDVLAYGSVLLTPPAQQS